MKKPFGRHPNGFFLSQEQDAAPAWVVFLEKNCEELSCGEEGLQSRILPKRRFESIRQELRRIVSGGVRGSCYSADMNKGRCPGGFCAWQGVRQEEALLMKKHVQAGRAGLSPWSGRVCGQILPLSSSGAESCCFSCRRSSCVFAERTFPYFSTGVVYEQQTRCIWRPLFP